MPNSNISSPLTPSEVMTKFAPMVYLHPADLHRPISMQNYLAMCSVFPESGVGSFQASLDLIGKLPVGWSEDTSYLAWHTDITMPTADNNFPTGDQLVAQSDGSLSCEAACYSHSYTQSVPGDPTVQFVDIIYSFLYAFSGFQMFRGTTFGANLNKTRNFEWANFARHQGDWEHITVRLSSDLTEVLGVYYSQHGVSKLVEPPNIQFFNGTHPCVYSALNSHASYPAQEINKVGTAAWLSLIDFCTTLTSEVEALRMYPVMPPPAGLPALALPVPTAFVPWNTQNNLIEIMGDEPFTNFQGLWGAQAGNPIQNSPPLPGVDIQNTLAKLAHSVGMLKKYESGNGPPAPWVGGPTRGWYQDKERGQFVMSSTAGGPHGGEFDDSPLIVEDFPVSPVAIWLRAGERLNQINMRLSNDKVLTHGGNGGSLVPPSNLGIPMPVALDGNPITTVEVYADKDSHTDHHTRIFWIKITLENGETLEAGTMKAGAVPTKTWTVPQGYVVSGFFGRSGTEVDMLGLIYVKVPSPSST